MPTTDLATTRFRSNQSMRLVVEPAKQKCIRNALREIKLAIGEAQLDCVDTGVCLTFGGTCCLLDEDHQKIWDAFGKDSRIINVQKADNRKDIIFGFLENGKKAKLVMVGCNLFVQPAKRDSFEELPDLSQTLRAVNHCNEANIMMRGKINKKAADRRHRRFCN